jgi:hypothetical protein
MDSSNVATWEEQLSNNSELDLFHYMEETYELPTICGDKTIADFVDFVYTNVAPDKPDLIREDHIFYPNLLLEFLHKMSPDENIDKDSIYCKCSTCEATLDDEDNMFRGYGEGVRLCKTCHTEPESN